MAGNSETSAQIGTLQALLDRWKFVPSPSGPAVEEHIAQREAALGQSVPADFRWFSLTHGRGYLTGPYVPLSIEIGTETVEGIRHLGIDKRIWCQPLYRPLGEVPGLLPCGQGFYFRLDGISGDGVWYSDEREYPIHSLVRVADSFTDLLASAIEARR